VKKTILVLGATGEFGNGIFQSLLKYKDFEVFGTAKNDEASLYFDSKVAAKVFNFVQIENEPKLIEIFNQIKPDVVINCVGLIKQVMGEFDAPKAIFMNALFPHKLASLCGLMGARLIHFSTDCVFSGKKGNYKEIDASDAEDVYGKTKYLGEISNLPHVITIRTSIIGHSYDNHLQLVDWFLAQKDKTKGYTKVIYSGLPTVEMGRILAEYIIPNHRVKGLYQVSSDPISKYDLLKLIAKEYGKKIEIEPYESAVSDRSLDSTKFRKISGYMPPTWSVLVKKMHQYYKKDKKFIQI